MLSLDPIRLQLTVRRFVGNSCRKVSDGDYILKVFIRTDTNLINGLPNAVKNILEPRLLQWEYGFLEITCELSRNVGLNLGVFPLLVLLCLLAREVLPFIIFKTQQRRFQDRLKLDGDLDNRVSNVE